MVFYHQHHGGVTTKARPEKGWLSSSIVLLTTCIIALTGTVAVAVESPKEKLRYDSSFSSSSSSSINFAISYRQLQLQQQFQTLNELFVGAIIDIPIELDERLDGEIGFALQLSGTNIQCQNLEIGDIILEATDSNDIIDHGDSNDNNNNLLLPVITILDMDIIELDFECSMDYKIVAEQPLPFVPDPSTDGTVTMKSLDNTVQTQFIIESSTPNSNANNEPTISVTMSNKDEDGDGACFADLNIEDMNFSTNNVGEVILNAMEGLLRGVVTEALEGLICTEMMSIAVDTIPDIFSQVTESLNPYLLQEEEDLDMLIITNPLYQEEQFFNDDATEDSRMTLIDFQNASASSHQVSELTHLILGAIDEIDEWLGSSVVVDNGDGEEESTRDLVINTLIRDFLLDDSGAFVWDMTTSSSPSMDLNFLFNKQGSTSEESSMGDDEIVLLETHDELLQMKVTLDRIEIRGLDSMTKLDTFERIGKHTLLNTMSWKYLNGTAKVTFQISPSTLPSSIWSQVQPGLQLLEEVELFLGAEQIQAVLSVFLAIREKQLGQVPLGSLFRSESVASCVFSTIYEGQLISGFDVSVVDLLDPTVTGFSSTGLDRVLTEATDLLYNMYEPWLIQAMPIFAQTTLRDNVNNIWMDFLRRLHADHAEACPLVDLSLDEDNKIAYLDFRDLLLPADEALAVGGTGEEPYGDIVSFVLNLLQEQLLVVDNNDVDDRYGLNSMLLDPLTKAQSGEEGTLHFKSDLVTFLLDKNKRTPQDESSVLSEIASSMFEYLEFRLYDTKIRNINTVVAPTYLLRTSDSSPFLLENQLQFGPVPEKPLNASVRVLVGVGSGNPQEEKPFFSDSLIHGANSEAVRHEMDISLSADSLKIAADFLAMVDATKLQRFPLEDIANLYCWLAAIPAPALNERGELLQLEENGEPEGLKLKSFLANFLSLAMDVQCVNDACSEGAFGALMELSAIWRDSNVTTTLGERYEDLAAELLTGGYVHTQIARWLEAAPKYCPRHNSDDDVLTVYPSLGIPRFSAQSIDTIVFTALTGAQAALLVLSSGDQSSSSSSGRQTVPSVRDSNGEKQLIDFTKTDGGVETLADLIPFIFSQANEILGSGKVVFDMVVNSIIRDILGDQGVLDLQFEDTLLMEVPNLHLRLNSLGISGLDTFTKFNILDAVAPQMLQSSIRMNRLAVDVNIGIVSGTGKSNDKANFTLSFAAEGIEAALDLFAAIDADKLDNLEVGSLLEIKKILPCIFTAVDSIFVSSANLSVQKLTDISVQGLLPATSEAFSKSMAEITSQLSGGIDGFLSPMITAVLNGLLSSYTNSAKCENVISSASRRQLESDITPPFLDFRDLFLSKSMAAEYGGTGEEPYGNLFRAVLAFVQLLMLRVDPSTQLSAVNSQLVAPLTLASSNAKGSIIMAGDIVDHEQRIQVGGLDALLTFQASDARIDNLDTFGAPMALFKPVVQEPYLLNNTATLGVPVDRPLRMSIRLLLGLEDGEAKLRNDIEISVDMQAATVVLTALVKIVEGKFASFPLGDILNQDCWLALIPSPPLDEYGFRKEGVEPSATLSELAASVSMIDLNIRCFNCTSPGLRDFDADGSKDIVSVMNDMLDYVTDLLEGRFLQLQIDRALNSAAKRCPHASSYDPNFAIPTYAAYHSSPESSMTFFLMILIVTGILLAVLAVITISVRCFVRARHRRLLHNLPSKQLFLLEKEQEQEDKRRAELNACTRSLFQSSATIPVYVRYLVPVILLVNIGFFLSGHLSLGATVNIEAQLAGESFQVDGFFSFSMAKSTIDIWNAGGKTLAALIFIFSGLWPYTKLLITIFLWFVPPSKVSMATRENVLLWLDTLAKWSMVDIFVLLVSIAGFRVSVVSPDVDFLPEKFYSVDLMVVPLWGLYANMIAQLISQLSSHFIIYYHRRVVDQATRARRALFRKTADFITPAEDDKDNFLDERRGSSTCSVSSSSVEDQQDHARKEKLCQHAFVRPHSDSNKLVTRAFVNPILILFSLGLAALLIAGCAMPSFSLEVMGMMGVLVESGKKWNEAVEEYSIFTITQLLLDQAAIIKGARDNIGLGSLSALLVFTVLIVPLIQTMALLYHWFAPMNKITRRRMEWFVEITKAWQYVEVYLIATIVASWQLGPISEFMMNSYCGSLDETFAMLAYYGILKESDAQCFRVEASIESAAYLLAASAILLTLLNTYVCNASHQYFRDVEKKSRMAVTPTSQEFAASSQLEDTTAAGASRAPYSLNQGSGDEDGDGEVENYKDEEADWDESDPLKPTVTIEEEVVEDDSWRRSKAVEKIHPVPVLFSDNFRWTLRSQEEERKLHPATVTKDGPPSLSDSTDPSDESLSLLMKGDAPGAIASPSPCNTGGDETNFDFEGFEDERVVNGNSLGDEDSWDTDSERRRKDEAIKVENLESQWEDDGSSISDGRDRSVATTDGSDTYAMDQSQITRMSEYQTAHDEEDDSPVLLGSGNVVLQAYPPHRTETFDDELETVNDEDDSSNNDDESFQSSVSGGEQGILLPRNQSRSKPQGHSLLQAAFLEDMDDAVGLS